MKKVTLKKLDPYRLSVEEKKSIKGGYDEVTYPDDNWACEYGTVKYLPPPMCSWDRPVAHCIPCSDPLVQGHPDCPPESMLVDEPIDCCTEFIGFD